MRRSLAVLALGAWGILGCSATDGAPGRAVVDGPRVAIDVAALNLPGVGDVVWDVEVVNGQLPTPDVVWQRRLSSSAYGDGAGSASYVGTCDADPSPVTGGTTVSANTVKVWVVGVYSAPVSSLGTFASGADGGVTGDPMDFQNPTTPVTTPLTQVVVCRENADVAVQFDVALMRPAQQGFFDIAVNFNNIFCSAKFDCCTEDGLGECASDISLLFGASGSREATMVLGFACTAGPRADVETELYLDALTLDCTDPASGFAADFVIDPSGAAGNQCGAGAVGGGDCAAVTAPTGLDADAYLYQVAVFRGLEQLQSGGNPAQKAFWTVALGVNRKVGGGVGIEDCWLRTQGTADDALGSSVVDNGVIAAGAVYPFVQWDVNLGTCKAEPLTFGDSAAMVRTEYTGTSGAGTAFAFGFGPSMPAGSFCPSPCIAGTCVSGACACDPGASGDACDVRTADCTGLPPNAHWNTVSSITQSWDGNTWLPTTAGAYSATASTTSCVFDCDAMYAWDGGACVLSEIAIVANATARSWQDGSYAPSCDAYLHPTAPYTYTGDTGDGLYTISPAGTPFDAWCDQSTDNGGWTLVFRLAENNWDHNNADNVPPTPTKTKAKFASSVINQISGQVVGGGSAYELRLEGPYTSTLMRASEPFYVEMNTWPVTIEYDCNRDGVYEKSRTWNSWTTDRGAGEGASWVRDWVYPENGQCNAWNGGNVLEWWAGTSTTPDITRNPIHATPTGYDHAGSLWLWVR